MNRLKSIFSGKIIKSVIIILIIAGLGTGGFFVYKNFNKANAQSASVDSTAKVIKGDLDVAITGTGTVQPISRYDIVPLVKGNILSAPFEEGMEVKKGDLLYKIDDSDLSFNIQKAQNGIEKLQINNNQNVENINYLVVYSPIEGKLTNLNLKEGDQVGNNAKVGDVTNNKKLIATIPFIKADLDKIKVGQSATLQAVNEWSSADGHVKSISSSGNYNYDGTLTYNVEIEVDNPGSFVVESTSESIARVSGSTVTTGTEQTTVTEVKGTVNTSSGNITSYYSGKLSYADSRTVSTQTSGKVKKIYVKNNEWVKAGQKILELENDSLSDTIYKNSLDIKDSQLSLEAQKKQLNDYNILSPIDGKVIKKSFKAGDTINNGNNSTVLMTVADLSKMIFTIDVDELDIAKVNIGQKVDITADALPGANLTGEVTNISVEGKTQNGVTTYPVQVTVSDPGKLMPGMNVNAKILVESKKNVLLVPLSAVTKMGNKSFVFVKSNGPAKKDGTVQGDKNSHNLNQNREAVQNQQGPSNNNVTGNNQRQNNQNQNGRQSVPNMGERQRKEVVVGINNDNFIEIVSGLNEGDTVYLPQQSMSRTNTPIGPGMMGPGGFGGGTVVRQSGGTQRAR